MASTPETPSSEPPVPLLKVVDIFGPVLFSMVEIRSDGVMVRNSGDGLTVEESRMTALERYRLEVFLASPRLEQAFSAIDVMPEPTLSHPHEVSLIHRGKGHSYEVTCRPPADPVVEMVELLNEILVAHFGHEARLRLIREDCE